MTTYTQEAFKYAIERGVLSDNMNTRNFAGDYMFMGEDAHGLAFKNIITRQYVHCKIEVAA